MNLSLNCVKSGLVGRLSCACINRLSYARVAGRSCSSLSDNVEDQEPEKTDAKVHRKPKQNTLYTPPPWKVDKANEFFLQAGKRAFLQTSAYKPEQSPNLILPEVAFIGRTSVGKSSLINAVMDTKKLARTSREPGRTRLVNFFNIENKMYLVDLPGYGFAPGLGRDGYYFVKVAEKYLEDRRKHKLRNICLLIDGEVGVKKNDLIAFEMLEEFGIPYQVVVTKIDRASQAVNDQVVEKVNKTINKHSTICLSHIFKVSAKKKTGLGELRCFIAESAGIRLKR